MRTTRVIHTVSAHAGGEVGDVIVGGVAPPPGDTLWAQRDYLEEDGTLRDLMLNEPRGGVFRHVNLLVPPKNPAADMGFLIMEPSDTPPMSGSNSMCVATVLLETGILPMREGVTHLTLEAPGGLVPVEATCADGRVMEVAVENVAAFAAARAVRLEVPGFGTLTVDTAFGGDSFVVVDAAALGFQLVPEEARDLAVAGMAITRAATDAIGFSHPTLPWGHISFCLFKTAPAPAPGGLATRHAVAIRPGKIDRSATGTAVCAHMALLAADGALSPGERLTAASILGTTFTGTHLGETTVGPLPAITPRVAGRAWIFGTHQHMLAPDDPFPRGYRLSDTWPTVI
ncbi:MAG: proline racemase family protein [Pseudomonadota bacterium]